MDGADPTWDETDTVAALFRAYDAHDAAAAAALYRPAGWHEEAHAPARRRQGPEAVRAGLDVFFAMLPDVRWTRRQRLGGRTTVAVVYTLTGRMSLDLGPLSTKGRAICLEGVLVVELEPDGIAGTRDIWDPAAFERQIREGAVR